MTLIAAQTVYWLLFLHVLAAMVWVGGGVMLAVTAARVAMTTPRRGGSSGTGCGATR